MMSESERFASLQYCRHRSASSGFAVRTRPPKPAFRNDFAIARPVPEVLPAPVLPKTAVPSHASLILHGSFLPNQSNGVSRTPSLVDACVFTLSADRNLSNLRTFFIGASPCPYPHQVPSMESADESGSNILKVARRSPRVPGRRSLLFQ